MIDIYYIPSKRTGHNGYISDNSKESDDLILNPHDLEWCKHCVHYGYVGTYNACSDGNWFTILRRGPLAVSYCGWCKHFLNDSSEEGKVFKNSKFKQKLLEGMGFKQR